MDWIVLNDAHQDEKADCILNDFLLHKDICLHPIVCEAHLLSAKTCKAWHVFHTLLQTSMCYIGTSVFKMLKHSLMIPSRHFMSFLSLSDHLLNIISANGVGNSTGGINCDKGKQPLSTKVQASV